MHTHCCWGGWPSRSHFFLLPHYIYTMPLQKVQPPLQDPTPPYYVSPVPSTTAIFTYHFFLKKKILYDKSSVFKYFKKIILILLIPGLDSSGKRCTFISFHVQHLIYSLYISFIKKCGKWNKN